MTAKMTRNILLMLVTTVLMGIVLNLYIHNTGTVPAADTSRTYTAGSVDRGVSFDGYVC